ncbi:uncharacterized protein LOC128203565 isoform X2 [Mya arenaria]|uniref:uncharacterized protein LOC128203565 isoform X2 n=1 Tax=Mya arenaria TaxID=6604 RepID=UPI0022E5A73F|nr:uncharacterized protein LOC128203565 isoform X2 [Mya arenaria]
MCSNASRTMSSTTNWKSLRYRSDSLGSRTMPVAHSQLCSMARIAWYSPVVLHLALILLIVRPAPSDKMTDLQSLSVYLKEQDEKGYKAALGCQDMSLNSSSFWSYGRPSLDLSHVFRNNQFQLASQSQQSHKSWTNDSDNLGEEVWRPLGVTDDDLFLWIERLRKSWEVMGVSASSCGIEVVVGASMGNHGANICPQILSL